jgi:hypothetical protein
VGIAYFEGTAARCSCTVTEDSAAEADTQYMIFSNRSELLYHIINVIVPHSVPPYSPPTEFQSGGLL